ncbi:hypothetical protein AB1L42_23675, partial [Thalassoglobus sp. JC818]|uniref:hypothetical protein n=1 Tax=Thalassoglobus sp. JC818 TaxID=3232136 RepID=UPI00345B0DF6
SSRTVVQRTPPETHQPIPFCRMDVDRLFIFGFPGLYKIDFHKFCVKGIPQVSHELSSKTIDTSTGDAY